MAHDPTPTMAQWNALLKGKARNAGSDKCTLHL